MRTLYPPIEPYKSGHLDVGDGHRVYWEISGNPRASRRSSSMAGRAAAPRRCIDSSSIRSATASCCSTSAAAVARRPTRRLEANTTWHLVADMERLRADDRASSNGSSSAAPGARPSPSPMRRPTRSASANWSCAASSRCGARRSTGTTRRARPGSFRTSGSASSRRSRTTERGDLIAAYHRRLTDPDPPCSSKRRGPGACGRARPSHSCRTRASRDSSATTHYALAFARIENHYFVQRRLPRRGPAPARRHRLRDIPGVIVQGRYDVATPAATAWALHQAWPEARYILVADAGHAFSEPGILHHLIEATDVFAQG